jgi:hypothetical protein
MTSRIKGVIIKNLFKGLLNLSLGILTLDEKKIRYSLDFIYINIFFMTTLPICRPGPFINYSNNTFVEEPSTAKNFIDPINGAHDESEHWKWRYYLKQQKYNFEYGQGTIETLLDERYHTFVDRKATDIIISETKKLEDTDSVLFEAGWSYVAPIPFEWELTYRCKNGGTLALNSCFAKYSYPAGGADDSPDRILGEDPDNGEGVNELARRVKITLPARVFPGRVDMLLYANVGEDIAANAEIEFEWRFGPVGSFVD